MFVVVEELFVGGVDFLIGVPCFIALVDQILVEVLRPKFESVYRQLTFPTLFLVRSFYRIPNPLEVDIKQLTKHPLIQTLMEKFQVLILLKKR